MNLTIHGYIDYGMGLLLIFSPSLFALPVGIPALIVIVLGLFIFLYSLLTHYDLGAVSWIPLKLHLSLDMLTGIFLAISPWFLGFQISFGCPLLY